MNSQDKRKISAGTIIMLAMTILVLGGTFFVLLRLSSGNSVDLTRLRPGTIALQAKGGTAETAGAPAAEAGRNPATAAPAAAQASVAAPV